MKSKACTCSPYGESGFGAIGKEVCMGECDLSFDAVGLNIPVSGDVICPMDESYDPFDFYAEAKGG